MGGSPTPAPEPVAPARRAERRVEVEPEDVILGEEESEKAIKSKGKRSLTRPTGNVTTGGGGSSSGVQV